MTIGKFLTLSLALNTLFAAAYAADDITEWWVISGGDPARTGYKPSRLPPQTLDSSQVKFAESWQIKDITSKENGCGEQIKPLSQEPLIYHGTIFLIDVYDGNICAIDELTGKVTHFFKMPGPAYPTCRYWEAPQAIGWKHIFLIATCTDSVEVRAVDVGLSGISWKNVYNSTLNKYRDVLLDVDNGRGFLFYLFLDQVIGAEQSSAGREIYYSSRPEENAAIAVYDDKIFLSSRGNNGTLTAIDSSSGKFLWRYDFLLGRLFDPIVSNGVVFTMAKNQANQTSHLLAVDANSGQLKWISDHARDCYPSKPVSDGSAVYFYCDTQDGQNKSILAVDAGDGHLIGSYNCSLKYYPSNAAPACGFQEFFVTDHHLVATQPSRSLLLFDKKTTKILDILPESPFKISYHDGTVYGYFLEGAMTAYRLTAINNSADYPKSVGLIVLATLSMTLYY